jgi:hypothetical protein
VCTGAHCSSGRRSSVRATATYGAAGQGMAPWPAEGTRRCVCVSGDSSEAPPPSRLAGSCQTCAASSVSSVVCAKFGLIFVCFLLKLQGRGSAFGTWQGFPSSLELPNYLAVELPCSAWIMDGLVVRR